MAEHAGIKEHNRSGELLRKAREAQGLTVADIAECMSCSRGTVQRYERHGIQRTMRFNRFMAVVRAYKVSPDAIIDAACLEA